MRYKIPLQPLSSSLLLVSNFCLGLLSLFLLSRTALYFNLNPSETSVLALDGLFFGMIGGRLLFAQIFKFSRLAKTKIVRLFLRAVEAVSLCAPILIGSTWFAVNMKPDVPWQPRIFIVFLGVYVAYNGYQDMIKTLSVVYRTSN